MNGSESNPYIILLSDGADSSRDLANVLGLFAEVVTLDVNSNDEPPKSPLAIVADIDLEAPKSIAAARQRMKKDFRKVARRIFVVDSADHRGATQAAALTATDYIMRPLDPEAILSCLHLGMSANFDLSLADASADLREGVLGAKAVIVKMFEKLPNGVPLTADDVTREEMHILKALRASRLKGWLDTVGRHHVHTYRHCFFVTGVAVAFAQHLGMRESDQRRIARAALVHDVGKAFIPLTILDKPSKLTDSEAVVMRGHARLGFDVLMRQGGFSRETLDVVLHHHELLDGTGYPEGRQEGQIPDMIRMVTIADIFSALIEERAYKPAVPVPRVLQIMDEMGNKLDRDLFNAFRPVALQAAA